MTRVKVLLVRHGPRGLLSGWDKVLVDETLEDTFFIERQNEEFHAGILGLRTAFTVIEDRQS
jgi:hypothetical protein